MRLSPALATAVLTAAAAPSAARAAPATFEQLREQAQPLDSLGSFLERYAGGCDDPGEKAACQAKHKRAQAELAGKTFFLALDESASRLLQPGPYDAGSGTMRLLLTPFFDANGMALTEGAPLGLDSAGRPRVALMPLSAKVPPDGFPQDIERLLRTQNVRIQLVFKPLAPWALPGKNKKATVRGVKAKFLAVRLTHARSGEEIALKLSPR